MQPLDIAWVDTNDVCHLRCPTCQRGQRVMENTNRVMPLELFERIAARLFEDGYKAAALYSWTEPFLNEGIADYVAIARSAGLRVLMSSTLSLPRIPHLEDALAAGIDLLTISTSGTNQHTYEINHAGGRLDQVFANMERVREIISRRGLATQVDLRFMCFDYNSHQVEEMRAHAERLQFRFELVAAKGNPLLGTYAGNPVERARRERDLADRPTPEDQGKVCPLMFVQTSIDCAGDVYLCCVVPNEPQVRIGRYLDLSADEILARKFGHRRCRTCRMPRRDPDTAEAERLRTIKGLITKAHATSGLESAALTPD